VVGGLEATQGGEADDKIIAVLENDRFWRLTKNVSGSPEVLVNRLERYSGTDEMTSGGESQGPIERVFDRDRALRVVAAAIKDYDETHGR
jgi:inorganic pyrophosphatase